MTEWEETAENRRALCDHCGRRRICPAAYNVDVVCPAAYNVDVVCPDKEHEDFNM